MSYLLDTNVISELRKPRMHPGVERWSRTVAGDRLYLSVLVIGELRRGVEGLMPRDPVQARVLDGWLDQLGHTFHDRMLDVTADVADAWGRMNAARTYPVMDGLLAATAKVHDLTLVTRNAKDIAGTGANVLDPFDQA